MEFLNEITFQKTIEEMVVCQNMTYIEAVLQFCTTNEMDIEDIPKIISVNLRDKIKLNAMDDGLMKKESMLPGM